MLVTVRGVDRRTRQLHAWQEVTAVFCLILAVALAILVFGLARGDRTGMVLGGLMTLSAGLNLRVQFRRRPK